MRRPILNSCAAVLIYLAFAPVLAAAESDDAAEYAKCIRMAHVSPADGLAEAEAWESKNGGEPAAHCAALAMIGLRQFDQGAARLESLAADSERSPHLRAGMLDQAGQAWMLDREVDRAEADYSKALDLVPGAPDVLIDRAVARADQKNYQDALADLNLALTNDPNRADALTLRASAKRHLADRDGARADLAAALAAAPELAEAWLEKGILAAEESDRPTAKEAFEKTIALAPDTPAAATARQDLEALDAPPQ